MQFSDALNGVHRHGERWRAQVSADWMQGRSAFGGLQVALVFRAMRELAPADAPIRTLQVCFIAPVPEGTVEIAVRRLRTGKSAVQVEGQIVAGNEVLCTVLCVFGAARASAVSIVPKQPPLNVARPTVFPFIPGITPEFTRHFASKWLVGAIPFTGATGTELAVETELKDSGTAQAEHVIAIADLIPPIALSMLKQPSPGSTLTWMLEFLGDGYVGLPLGGWRVDASLLAATAGYTNQSAMLWGPGGIPVALSRQSMVVFG